MKQAVLRVLPTRYKYEYRLEVRSGHKGRGKVLYNKKIRSSDVFYSITTDVAQRISMRDYEVLLTYRASGEDCVFRYLGENRWAVFPECIFYGESPKDYNKWAQIKDQFYATGGMIYHANH